MKRFLLAALAATAALTGLAQTKPAEPFKPTFVVGSLAIRFNTATQQDSDGKPRAGVTDTYTLDLNVSNSVKYHGTITRLPYVKGGTFSSDQVGVLSFDVATDIINPANPAQTKNVGKLFGTVPVDKQNVYHFADSSLKISVISTGRAEGFESRFNGLALGKAPADSSVTTKLRQALSLSKSNGGKTSTISVTKYDTMEFRQLIVAAGPVKNYPTATVDGTMIYDYGRTAWFFQNVTITYSLEGRVYRDAVSGSIRWVEAADRKTTGNGEYQFDIRVNEPPPSETAAFAGSSDESDFFATDNSVPGLTGTMKYHDSLSGETTTASQVTIDLKGNLLHRQQAMVLAKTLIFVLIVPLNSD